MSHHAVLRRLLPHRKSLAEHPSLATSGIASGEDARHSPCPEAHGVDPGLVASLHEMPCVAYPCKLDSDAAMSIGLGKKHLGSHVAIMQERAKHKLCWCPKGYHPMDMDSSAQSHLAGHRMLAVASKLAHQEASMHCDKGMWPAPHPSAIAATRHASLHGELCGSSAAEICASAEDRVPHELLSPVPETRGLYDPACAPASSNAGRKRLLAANALAAQATQADLDLLMRMIRMLPAADLVAEHRSSMQAVHAR